MTSLKEKEDQAVARELGMEEGLSLVQVVGRDNEVFAGGCLTKIPWGRPGVGQVRLTPPLSDPASLGPSASSGPYSAL